ncbi:MAG: hypothetical protein H0U71_08375 [Gammaproteobacteria bacterium]|nr:hypothetical protein [Gammaproteobacteria bacterium]
MNITQVLSKFGLSDLSKIVFGEAVTHNDLTVVPVAKIKYGFGCGTGRAMNETGQGAGGGGGGVVSPIGFIEMNNGQTKFKTIRPPMSLLSIATTIALSSLVLARISRKFIKK